MISIRWPAAAADRSALPQVILDLAASKSHVTRDR
jgi:hypothetical protein